MAVDHKGFVVTYQIRNDVMDRDDNRTRWRGEHQHAGVRLNAQVINIRLRPGQVDWIVGDEGIYVHPHRSTNA